MKKVKKKKLKNDKKRSNENWSVYSLKGMTEKQRLKVIYDALRKETAKNLTNK